jgi:hypothetical protein
VFREASGLKNHACARDGGCRGARRAASALRVGRGRAAGGRAGACLDTRTTQVSAPDANTTEESHKLTREVGAGTRIPRFMIGIINFASGPVTQAIAQATLGRNGPKVLQAGRNGKKHTHKTKHCCNVFGQARPAYASHVSLVSGAIEFQIYLSRFGLAPKS